MDLRPFRPEEFRAAVVSAGLPCGPLAPLGSPAKRQVLSDGAVVVRAAPDSAVLRNSPAEEVAWARRISAVVPAQRPLTGPIAAGDWTLTVWEHLDGSAPTSAEARAHGSLLRRLHDLAPLPDTAADPGDQLDSARRRLGSISDPGVRSVLGSMLSVASQVLAASDGGVLVVSHGDAHDRNILVVDGVLHLLDFDSAGPAHRHVDVASGVYAWRVNRADEAAADAFLDGYGAHPDLDSSSLDALVWVRRVRSACTRAASGQDVSDRLRALTRTCPPQPPAGRRSTEGL